MKLLLVTFFSLCSLTGWNQNALRLDSLKKVLNDSSLETHLRLDAYHNYIQKGYLFTKPDSAIYHIKDYLKLANSASNDYEVGRALHQYGTSYAVRGKLDSCESYFRRAIGFHEKANNKLGLAKTSYNLGNVLYSGGKVDSSLMLYNRSMALYEELEMGSKLERGAYAIGRIHLNRGDYIKAIEQFDKGIAITHKFDLEKERPSYLIIKGDAFKKLGDFTEAIRNYDLALALSEKTGGYINQAHALNRLSSINTMIGEFENAIILANRAVELNDKAENLTNLTNSYSVLGDALAASGKYAESTAILEKSLVLAKQNNITQATAICLSDIGENYMALENLSQAQAYFHESLDIYESISFRSGISNIKSLLAQIEFEKGNTQGAIELAEKALDIAFEINAPDYKVATSSQLVTYLKASGKTALALSMLEVSTLLKDSLKQAENDRAVIKQQFSYDYAKKNLKDSLTFASEKMVLNERNVQQSRNLTRTLWALVIISLLAVLSFFLYGKIRKQKAVISKSLFEKETLLKEIHHRVKNNLQVVSSLLGWQTKTTTDSGSIQALKEGQSRVQSMSLIHQNLYSDDNLTGIEMKEYLENLSTNLYNTYTIDKNRITLELDVDPLNLDVDDVVPLGLIINELITNSLKYAFPNEGKGIISVSLKKVEEQLHLMVKDNGVGIENIEVAKNRKTLGFGLINAFSDKLNANLTIQSNQKGTAVGMTFSASKS